MTTDRREITRRIIVTVVVGSAILLGAVAMWLGQRDRNFVKHDISEFMKTDPKLILYSETAERSFDAGFARARAIAVLPDGNVLVAGDRAVRMFTPRGERVSQLDLPDSPAAIAADKDGRICVAFKSSAAVYRNGREEHVLVDVPAGAVLTAVAIRGPDIYLADAANRQVLHYHKLNLHAKITRAGVSDGLKGFNVPSPYFDFGLDSRGTLNVVDPGRHRILKINSAGEDVGAWKSQRSMRIKDFCGCCNPANIALMPDDSVVTAEKGLARVKLYNADGGFVGVVAGCESFPGYDPRSVSGDVGEVLDVAADATGRVLVLDRRAGRVRTFERIIREDK